MDENELIQGTEDTVPASSEPEEALPEPTQSIEDFLPSPALEVSGPDELRALIEAVIYVTEEPLTLDQIAAALEETRERIAEVLAQVAEDYSRPERGITIREVAGGYKMGTKPEHHEKIRLFVKKLKPPLKLSLPALETLAVIAYKQPVTAPEIGEIRGVQGTGVLKTLIDRKLIAPAGRKNVIGKPILYKTTKEFLVQFGLKDLAELPTLKEFEELRRLAFSDEPDIATVPAEPTQSIQAPPTTPPAQPAIEAAPTTPPPAEPVVEEAAPTTPPPVEAAPTTPPPLNSDTSAETE